MLQKALLNLLITLLTAFAFIATASAQTEEQKLEADAKSGAKDMCECMNLFFDALHPALIGLMNDMLEVGEEQAERNFLAFMTMPHPRKEQL